MKPHLRPLADLGRPLLWECVDRAFADKGWFYLGAKRGHGYTPEEAFLDWEEQSKETPSVAAAHSAD